MMTNDDRELAAASGAYALHALDGQEQRDFEALLERSPGLRDEVTELADTAVELGLAVTPELPSDALRARILAAAAATPQRDRGPAPQPVAEPALAPVIPLAWYRRPAAALATAAAAVVLVAAGVAGAGLVQSSTSASQLAAVATAPDAQHATVALAGGGSARVVWSDDQHRSAVRLTGAAALDVNRTYQLWYIDAAGTARSAGITGSSGDVVLDGVLRDGDTIGVTVEPAGGSTKPTSAAILAVATA